MGEGEAEEKRCIFVTISGPRRKSNRRTVCCGKRKQEGKMKVLSNSFIYFYYLVRIEIEREPRCRKKNQVEKNTQK